ncbi:hypothetical protein SAMN05216464_110162 [Mucilaginibacter pineti]|uniref:Uncharacterized protein n=1 Tax=Mucilaginibacter pineti TaxID=1391627 RepID=A0A1G7GIN7_9SPHI|nr:hypothetical protein [Mucilaginibacter pineti]SDE87943.1 hypothetical protein SAMN05216464_110162 [Mucilaginibacter pineti]
MHKLDTFIAELKNLQFPSDLLNSISESEILSDQEKKHFESIWKMATAFENWNHSDLAIGLKIAYEKLQHSFKLSEASINIIVRLASYDWK